MAEQQRLTSDKPRLILTHGEKGGVGKTTVARVIADYLRKNDFPHRAFDAEGETGQLLRFHNTATTAVDVTRADSVAPVLDYLMEESNGTGKRIALVDLGARTGGDLKSWLYRGGALEEAQDRRLGITLIYVLGGAIDSVGHLKECFAELGRAPEYILIKNYGVASAFEVYDNSKIRQELLAAGAKEIDLPPLDAAVYQSVDRASVSFQDFADNVGGDFSYTERRYCRTWLRECFTAFEEVARSLR